MPVFHIFTKSDWNKVWEYARGKNDYPKRGFVVSVRNQNRSDAQNRLMWSLIGDYVDQKQTIKMGEFEKQYPKEAWKAIFMNALGFPNNMLPTLDGSSFFVEGYRSSKLSVAEMSELLEFIFADGTERGVRFTKTGDFKDALGHLADTHAREEA